MNKKISIKKDEKKTNDDQQTKQIKLEKKKKAFPNIANTSNIYESEKKENSKINEDSKIKTNIINNSIIQKKKNNEKKVIVGLKKSMTQIEDIITTIANMNKKPKKKIKKNKKKKSLKRNTFINKQKQDEKQDIQIMNVMPKNIINFKDDDITFLNEIIYDNDINKENGNRVNNIELKKKELLLKEKYNLDKLILKKDKLQNYKDSYDNLIRFMKSCQDICMNQIYNKKMLLYKKTYLDLKKNLFYIF